MRQPFQLYNYDWEHQFYGNYRGNPWVFKIHMWQKSKVTTVIVYHDIVLYHTIAFKCKLTDVASFALLLDTFEPHLSRYCPVLILDLISILYTPFCPKGTLPPIRTHRSRQGKKEKVLQSCHEKRADLKDSYLSIKSALWIFSDTFSPLTGAVVFW